MLDRVVSWLVGLGVPGLVLLIAISIGGLTGGAAIVAALATLGGPFGMIGGIALLGLLVLVSRAIAKYGVDEIFVRVVSGLIQKGVRKEDIIAAVEYYPVSADLKRKLKELIQRHFGDTSGDERGYSRV